MAAQAAPQPGKDGAPDKEKAALEVEVARLSRQLEALREREEMYRSAAKLSNRLVWCADAGGRLVAISPLFESLTGVDPEEGWLKVAHPDDRPRVREQWEHSVSTGEPYNVEFRSLLKDGTPRMVLSRAVPIRDAQGRILRWYGSTEDIEEEWQAQSARRDALARLSESEELHRFTVELTRQIVWSVEPDGSGLTLSARYYELTGMATGGDPSEFVHPDDREHVFMTWVAALESGQPFADECRLRMKDGSYRYFRLRAAPQRNADGQIVRWYGMTEDIHEERVAEHAHRDVAERYRLAIQATNDAVWDYDIANGMIDWSDDSAEMFRSQNRPIGRTSIKWWEDHIHPDDRDAVANSLLQAIASGDTHWSATYRFIRDDGSQADMLDRGFIIRDAAGKAMRAVGAMADMTERNRAEAEIRRVQAELIHVSRLSAMGAMASALAHELNQPLAAVSNYISGARRIAGSHPAPPAALLDALNAAASGAHRAGEIVRRLRELVSRGNVAMMVEDLPRLIDEAGVLGFVDEKWLGVRHRVDLDPRAQWVKADRVQIQQVLINLIRNAVEAMEQGKEREIVISTHAAGENMVEIRVADNGPGIAPEHLDTLFSQFMTTKSGGMGIGLPICRTIVEGHGGKIWAENRPEGGARFRFTLQAARPQKSRRS
jgi:two-component system sensor kinase FixL